MCLSRISEELSAVHQHAQLRDMEVAELQKQRTAKFEEQHRQELQIEVLTGETQELSAKLTGMEEALKSKQTALAVVEAREQEIQQALDEKDEYIRSLQEQLSAAQAQCSSLSRRCESQAARILESEKRTQCVEQSAARTSVINASTPAPAASHYKSQTTPSQSSRLPSWAPRRPIAVVVACIIAVMLWMIAFHSTQPGVTAAVK